MSKVKSKPNPHFGNPVQRSVSNRKIQRNILRNRIGSNKIRSAWHSLMAQKYEKIPGLSTLLWWIGRGYYKSLTGLSPRKIKLLAKAGRAI